MNLQNDRINLMKEMLKILMLEDLLDDVGLIERCLQKEGLQFVTKQVDTREEFVAALKEFQPDVILSDHALPQFNSVEALRLSKKDIPKVVFILVTGTVSEEFAVNCLKQGADDYVLKSNLARLPLAINNSLKQKDLEIQKKQAEYTLRKQNEELLKINKELDSFVYNISHNLRAPLMSVLGLLNVAQLDESENKSPHNKYLPMMEKSILKLDDTLKEILDYSRNSRGEISSEKVNFQTLLADCFERVKFMNGSESIRKEVEIEESFYFYSDSYRLTVIFSNLISNSIKYRDINKPVSIIDIKITINESTSIIYYRDNGIGIAEEYLPRIFDMFFRATTKSEGAGLGLYIVKETAEKLGGKIEADSRLGEGVTFIIELPNRFP
jgi:signal transduction histidine kinase